MRLTANAGIVGSPPPDLHPELFLKDCDPTMAYGPCLNDDLELMGANFHRIYPVLETHRFGYLLTAIDIAEDEMLKGRERLARSVGGK